jgi:hypothetical protein
MLITIERNLQWIVLLSFVGLAGVGIACPDDNICRSCAYSPSFDSNFCNNCEDGYFDTSTHKCASAQSPIENCLTYIKAGILMCIECKLGFMVNFKERNCEKCATENCAFCQFGVCTQCLDRMVLKEDKTCDPNSSCQSPNCNICSGSNTQECAVCNLGYSLAMVTHKCFKGQTGCSATWNEEDHNCILCDEGFYISADGTCKSRTLEDKITIRKVGGDEPNQHMSEMSTIMF